MKHILVVYYSQSGDVAGAVESFVKPLLNLPEVEITWERIKPETPFPYPWNFHAFFDVFPECVLENPPGIYPVTFDPDKRFDLVILAYQVWFLSPSLPIQSFLKSGYARVLKDTKVITLVVARNMWYTASETMKRMIARAGGIHIDNVALTYQGSVLATFISTLWLMFTGGRNTLWGLLSPAGARQEDVWNLARFGRTIANSLSALSQDSKESLLKGLEAIKVDVHQVIPELLGRPLFNRWAKIVRASGRPGSLRRRPAVYLFIVFLVLAITLSIPMGLVLRPLIHPLIRKKLEPYVYRLKSPSGVE
ncbi:hypothetical protein KJ693_05385 [bacterium]|nr:hypothetical protein [bacterium]MBU1614732.1 hypothetical protein [bacterium]